MVSAMRTIGVCGVGMMGAAVGARLSEGGLRVVTALRKESTIAPGDLGARGIDVAGSVEELVGEVDVLLSIMGSSDAPGFGDQVLRALERSPREGLVFAECNLLEPALSMSICERIEAAGAVVVDAGICGAPPRPGHAPTFFVSGPRAGELAFLEDHGFPVWDVGPELGAASRLKVLSAASWQGSVALMGSVLLAARRHGLDGWLTRDLEEHQQPLFSWFASAIEDAVGKSPRWAPDMAVISQVLESAGVSGAHHEAAGEFYRALSRSSGNPADLLGIVAALDDALDDPGSTPTSTEGSA